MLTWIFFAGALICLAYFITIIIYAGITTTSSLIWILFAVFLFATAFILSRFLKYPGSIPIRLPVTMITLCGAGVVILLILEILIFYKVPSTAEPGLDYVIVLGSSVKKGAPGKILTRRLDKAVEYARENPGTMFVLSGGKDGFDSDAEALIMRDYLIEKGVPESSLLIEDESRNTRENIRYSMQKITGAEEEKQKYFGDLFAQEAAVEGVEMAPRIGLLTSNFHLYRATKIANRQGLERVYGIAAPSDPVLLVHLSVRDALAFLKDRLVGNL